MANIFSAVILIIAVPAFFVTAAPITFGRHVNVSEPQARQTLREGLIVLWNAAVSCQYKKLIEISSP